MPPGRRPPSFKDFLTETRRPLHSLAAIAPLVLAHAALVWLFDPPVRAAAANWVHWPLGFLGLGPGASAWVVAILFVLVGLALSARDLKNGRTRIRPLLIPWIWFEGALWGLFLHLAWNGLGRGAGGPRGLGLGDNLTLALGAGVYEELVFRVAIFWLVLAALRLAAGRPADEPGSWLRTAAAVLITSVLFALAHHLGPEPFSLAALSFRTIAAIAFTSLFAWRGLGVVTCAHVAYDIFVVAL